MHARPRSDDTCDDGNKEPPICAKRKTKASAVAWISGGKSLEPTETPVAKMGPVKKPMKMTAMDAAMMLGTLGV